jgi:hypothetical protein
VSKARMIGSEQGAHDRQEEPMGVDEGGYSSLTDDADHFLTRRSLLLAGTAATAAATFSVVPAAAQQPSPQAVPSAPDHYPRSRETISITVENLAPPKGTVLSQLWFGFHDGSFVVYKSGSPASPALERLAEDGNTGPLTVDFNRSGSGVVQGTVFGSDNVLNVIAPSSVTSMKVSIDPKDPHSKYFSYATMIVPSNDAFIANEDPKAHKIIDDQGNFLGAEILVLGSEVHDAGTEVNDEAPFHAVGAGPILIHNAGVVENGTVKLHEGYKPGGSILTNPAFANANFKVGGYRVARITVKKA